METKIALRYTGPAVDTGLMDVYEASANMIAFSEFVVLSAKTAFGDSITARAEVAGFGRGSFITDLVFNVGLASASIFSAHSSDQIWDLVKEAFTLWKHLKGSPPSKVDYGGQHVTVTNNNGEIIQVNTQSFTLVMSEKGSESVGRFVQKALDKPGMDAIEISSGTKTIDRVTQSESAYFVPVALAETITDTVVKMGLMLEAPVFKDGNKWRFSDGQQSFYADIEDKEFLARVNAGERFGKGDILYADVRINQQMSGMKISAERSLVKVHEHKIASFQLPLS